MLAKIKQVDDIRGGVREIEITLSFVRISDKEKEQIMRLFNGQDVFDVELRRTSLAPDEATPCLVCGDDLFRCSTCQEAHEKRLAGKA